MDQFKSEGEMLIYIDDFLFKSKGVKSELRNELVEAINKVLEKHDLNTDDHNFVDLSKL